MGYAKDVMAGLREPAKKLRSMIPDVYGSFVDLSKTAMSAGAVDVKTKELIALAISVSSKCDGCIASHARGAARAGATPEEVAETLGVAIMMNGGPATVYGPRAMDAFMDFYEPDEA